VRWAGIILLLMAGIAVAGTLRTGNLSVDYILALKKGENIGEDGTLKLVPRMAELGVDEAEDYICLLVLGKEEGKFDWKLYKRNFLFLKRCEMGYVVYPWLHFAPEWVWEKYKLQGYVCLEHDEEIKLPSIWAPAIKVLYNDFYGALAEQFGDSIKCIAIAFPSDYGEVGYPEGMANWIVNTPHLHRGFWCGDKYARQDFASWLKAKYGSIEKLDGAWGEDFDDFARVEYPKREKATPRAWLDFAQWYCESQARFLRDVVGIVRKYFPQTPLEVKVGYGSERLENGCDYTLMVKAAASCGVRIHSTHANTANYFYKRISTACRFYGVGMITEPPGGVPPENMPRRFFEDISSGVEDIFDYPGNIINGHEVYKKYFDWVGGDKPIVDVALFHLTSQHWFSGEMLPGALFTLAGCIRDICDYDIVDERLVVDGALQNYRVLIMPQAGLMDRKAGEIIRNWVKDGGALILTDGKYYTAEGEEIRFDKGDGHVIVLWGMEEILREAREPTVLVEELRKILYKALPEQGITIRSCDREMDGVMGTVFRDYVLLYNSRGVEVRKRLSYKGLKREVVIGPREIVRVKLQG